MSIFQIIKIVISLMPIIRDAVDQAEELFPENGSGAKKLAIVKTTMEHAISVVAPAESIFTTVWPMISGIVGALVDAKFNSAA